MPKLSFLHTYPRATAVVGLLILAVATIGGTVLYREHLRLHEEVEAKGRMLAKVMAEASATALYDGDYTLVQRLARRLADDPDVRCIAVVDLASSRWAADSEKTEVSGEPVAEGELAGLPIAVQETIVFKGRPIGLVLVGTSLEGVRQRATKAGALMALVCLVGIGAILAGATLYGRARALERERDQLEAQQAERRRIYDEAHDRVYNRLRGLGFQAQVALQDPSRMRTTLAAIDPALRQVVEELQAIIQPLEETYPDSQREAEMAARAFADDLKRTCEEFAASYGLAIRFSSPGEVASLVPPRFRVKLLDVLRIALDNVASHAQARGVEVVLITDRSRHPQSVTLSVSDDGIGCEGLDLEALPEECRGLRNLQRMAQEMGGDYHITTGAKGGTTVMVRIPRASDS